MADSANYVELHCHTNYSFLDGASPPDEIVRRAAELGMPTLAVTDHQGLYGAVKFRNACREHGVRPIYGAEIDLAASGELPGGHLTLLVENAAGWHNLCHMLTQAGFGGTKHERPVPWKLLERHAGGLIALTGCRDGVVAAPARREDRDATLAAARRLAGIFGPENCYVELQRHFDRGDKRLNATLLALANHLKLPLVATNNVHYATPDRVPLQHVLTCIRHLTAIDSAGSLLYATPHRGLKSARSMAALFSDLPEAVANTVRIAERCEYKLDHSQARMPDFPVPAGETPFSYLVDLCYAGLRRRYDPVTPEALSQLGRELALIEKNHLAGYFLVVHDICRFAREQGVVGQGRGSAAGSIVAYTLGITAVDPIAQELLFDRFLSEDSHATPDIDVDFAADRREEVIQYVYGRYGAEYTAMVCNVVTFQARSAVADVGKVLGFPADLLTKVRESLYTRSAGDIAPDLSEVTDFARNMTYLPWQMLVHLCGQIAHFPRHLSIHNGGMLITGQPLAGLVPLEPATMAGRVVVQWDKDDVEDVGLIKIDLLSLCTLGMVAEAFTHIAERGGPILTIDSIPPEDPVVYEMLRAADAIGCFQVESRAQMSLLPRMQPSCMNDLIVEVSLIRPGPIEGGMAQTYLVRRDGDEPVEYWHPSLEPILKETMGVLIYQEQVIRAAMVIAGFTGAQADGLRRSMSRKRGLEELEKWRDGFVEGARARDVSDEIAHLVFDHLRGFASYGFCKSHAASFARIAYTTSWLKCYHAIAFYCGMLNAQPMGFYSVEVVLEDAKRHGIGVYPLDVNRSRDTWFIEGDQPEGLRVPFTRLKGLGDPLAEAIVAEREGSGAFRDLWDFVCRVRPPRALVEKLIRAGAFDGLVAMATSDGAALTPRGDASRITAADSPDRRDLLWALGEMRWDAGPMDLPPVVVYASLPVTTRIDEMAADYGLLGLAQAEHLMSLYRPQLAAMGCVTSAELETLPHGVAAKIAGRLEIVQRPGPAKGIAFVSIEDEFGLANLLCYPLVYDRVRSALRASPVILAEGHIQRQKRTLHLIVDNIQPVDVRSGVPGLDPEELPGPAKEYQ